MWRYDNQIATAEWEITLLSRPVPTPTPHTPHPTPHTPWKNNDFKGEVWRQQFTNKWRMQQNEVSSPEFLTKYSLIASWKTCSVLSQWWSIMSPLNHNTLKSLENLERTFWVFNLQTSWWYMTMWMYMYTHVKHTWSLVQLFTLHHNVNVLCNFATDCLHSWCPSRKPVRDTASEIAWSPSKHVWCSFILQRIFWKVKGWPCLHKSALMRLIGLMRDLLKVNKTGNFIHWQNNGAELNMGGGWVGWGKGGGRYSSN